jgi:hypothetical protein
VTYAEKLRDPRWQKRRLEVMQRDNWKCLRCGDGTKTLNVHHKEYIKGRDPWQYPNHLLETLCEDCHGEHHGVDRKERLEALAESVMRNLHKAEEWVGDPLLVEECLLELDDDDGFIAFRFGWHGFNQMMEIVRWISIYQRAFGEFTPWLQAVVGFATISPGIVDTYYAFFDRPPIETYADLILLAPALGIQILHFTDKESLRNHLAEKRSAHRHWKWAQPKSWAEALDSAKQLSQPDSERWLAETFNLDNLHQAGAKRGAVDGNKQAVSVVENKDANGAGSQDPHTSSPLKRHQEINASLQRLRERTAVDLVVSRRGQILNTNTTRPAEHTARPKLQEVDPVIGIQVDEGKWPPDSGTATPVPSVTPDMKPKFAD